MLRHTRIGSLPDLSAVEQWSRMFERHPKIKVGCRNLAQNPREFGKSMDWLLTGKPTVEPVPTLSNSSNPLPFRSLLTMCSLYN